MPSKNRILIFDKVGSDQIIDLIKPYESQILPIRFESINLRILMQSLFIKGSFKSVYIDTYIKNVDPKIVITFTDNNINFYYLKNRHRKIEFISIQNGWRSYYSDIFELFDNLKDQDKEKLFVDYMFVFGNEIAKKYKKYVKGNYFSIGSIRNNVNKILKIKKNNRIIFISQWINKIDVGDKQFKTNEYCNQVEEKIFSFMISYANINNKEIFILPRMPIDSSNYYHEIDYFNKIMKQPTNIIKKENVHSSYEVIDSAELVVGIDSTLLYESLSRGNKTAIFSIRGNVLNLKGYNFGWPSNFLDKGLFWTNILNQDDFKNIFDYLFSITEKEWKNMLNSNSFNDLMYFDPENKIIKSFFKDKIRSIL